MFFRIDLKDFSIDNIDAKKRHCMNGIIFGFEGNFWTEDGPGKTVPGRVIRQYFLNKRSLFDVLEGNFLFYAIDPSEKKIEIFTDITGSLPFYYRISNGFLTCGSDLSQIVEKSGRIHKNFLFDTEKYENFPSSYLPFKGIRKIDPGYSVFIDKDRRIINHGFDFNNYRTMSGCIENIRENVKKYCKTKKIGIFATGGLDSSLLAYLIKDLDPRLYFVTVDSDKAAKYNKYSIEKCRLLSKTLGLKFRVIPLTKKDYVFGTKEIVKIAHAPILDPSLPAVYASLHKISGLSEVNYILSGMAVNELLDMPKDGLRPYINKKISTEINIHKRFVKCFNGDLDFYAPYLNKSFLSYIFQTPLEERINKLSFKNCIISSKLLPNTFVTQPSYHSIIPQDFLIASKKMLFSLKKQNSQIALYKKIMAFYLLKSRNAQASGETSN